MSKTKASKPRGYVLWEGPSPFDGSPIVAIATLKSVNRKTGDMVQVWILRQDIAPHEALATGADAAVCGDCPLRGDGTGAGRACYVTLVQAPLMVWKAYRAGVYRRVSRDVLALLFRGLKVRFGAYGDPAMLPISLVATIALASNGWTGYTHQYRWVTPEWSRWLMASADTVADRRTARLMGYRAFGFMPRGTDLAGMPGVMECAATRKRNPLTCEQCLACGGTRNGTIPNAVDVLVAPHGAGAKHLVLA